MSSALCLYISISQSNLHTHVRLSFCNFLSCSLFSISYDSVVAWICVFRLGYWTFFIYFAKLLSAWKKFSVWEELGNVFQTTNGRRIEVRKRAQVATILVQCSIVCVSAEGHMCTIFGCIFSWRKYFIDGYHYNFFNEHVLTNAFIFGAYFYFNSLAITVLMYAY